MQRSIFPISILIFLSFIFISATTSDINYKSKQLSKTLAKLDMNMESSFTEMNVPDSIKQNYRLKGKYYKAHTDKSYPVSYVYVGRVNCCRAGGCDISEKHGKDKYFEYFDYFILFDEQKKVKEIKIFKYQASHGYEITAKGWLKQFIGADGSEELEVDKNIDAISGATISVNAITFDVQLKLEILQLLTQ